MECGRKACASGENGLMSKASDLSSLIDYRPGAVVSRALIQKKAGTVTIFSFDKGEGLSEHTAPFDALVCILDGTAEITIGEESLSLGEGQMTIMPANVPHALTAVTPYKMMLVMIRSD